MSKKSVLVAVALVICLVFTQGVFASEVEYPNEYRQFEVKESYPLAELFWRFPALCPVSTLSLTGPLPNCSVRTS